MSCVKWNFDYISLLYFSFVSPCFILFVTLGRGQSWDRRQSVYSKVTNNLWNSLALLLTIFYLPKGSWFCFRCGYDYNWIKFVRDNSMIQTQSRQCLIFKKCQILMSFYLCSHSRKGYLQISNLSPWGLWKFLVTYLYHLYINICSQVTDSSFLKKKRESINIRLYFIL